MPIWKRTMECSCGNVEDRDVDASFVIRDRSTIYQDLKMKITPGTVNNSKMLSGGACLSSLNRDAMIQEAPAFNQQFSAKADHC